MCMCVCVMCSWSGAQVSLSFVEIEGTYGTMRCHSLVAFRLQPCPYLGVHASYSPLVCPSLSPPSAISRAVICLVTTVSESFAHETSQIISEVGGWVQPGKRFVSCVHARAVCIPSEIHAPNRCSASFPFPFGPTGPSLFPLVPRAFPFSLVRSGVPLSK